MGASLEGLLFFAAVGRKVTNLVAIRMPSLASEASLLATYSLSSL